MKSLPHPLRALSAGCLILALGSCSEKLDSSAACAILCPPVGGHVQNVTLDAIVLDTTVQSFSGLGAEPSLLLASRGDTLDARIIIRFDSLPSTFVEGADTAKAITLVDSAYILMRLDTTSIKGGDPVTIEAYDVDTTANDTSTAAVLALFRPDRFLSSQTFTRAQLTDSLRYFISNAAVLAKLQAKVPFRVGLRAVSPPSSQLRFQSSETISPPLLRFRVSADTAVRPIIVRPRSKTPADDVIAAANLADYTVFAARPPAAALSDLAVGGLPARRIYVRFDIPSSIIDSSTIVRATLLLNQLPNALLDPTDTVVILPALVVAGAAVTDPTKAAQIVTDIALDTVLARPGDAGLKEIELARALLVWRSQKPAETPRAVILRTANEGGSALEIRFSSLEAAAALRPRLRISYTKQVPLGLP